MSGGSGPDDMQAKDSKPRRVESNDPETVEAEVVPEDEEVENDDESNKDLTEVAEAVNRGEYGVGQERRQKLAEAGFDPKEVEAEIVRLRNS